MPALGGHDAAALIGTAASMFVVILTQSAATSRAYAMKYEDLFSEDTNLVGLAAANVAAALSGTFAVNGSPTQTQMVDRAGGRAQPAGLTHHLRGGAHRPALAHRALVSLPVAAMAAVVFLIAVDLITVTGMRHILAVRRHEFAVALLTAAAVMILGVEDGIVLAVIASVIDHLRHSYHPRNSVLVKSPAGHWQPAPVVPGARTEEGLAVYRFGTSFYYANASRLLGDITALAAQGSPPRWIVLDGAAIGDVDYTAAAVLARVIRQLQQRHIRLVVSSLLSPVREQLGRYGINAAPRPRRLLRHPRRGARCIPGRRTPRRPVQRNLNVQAICNVAEADWLVGDPRGVGDNQR